MFSKRLNMKCESNLKLLDCSESQSFPHNAVQEGRDIYTKKMAGATCST